MSRVNVSLSDFNFERDLVRFQRGERRKGEKRGDRAKRHDEIIPGRGGAFSTKTGRAVEEAKQEGGRFRNGGHRGEI